MTALGWERGGLALTLYFVAVAVGRFRAGRRRLAVLQTPLFDAAVLEAVFHPRLQDGDDAALLADVRETFASLNRQADAEEFLHLHTQIGALSQTLTPAQSATLRRAVLRLLASRDLALQGAGAQTAAELGLTDAIPRMQALLDGSDAGDAHFRKVLEEALARLSEAAVATG